jgi:hypothetical protein
MDAMECLTFEHRLGELVVHVDVRRLQGEPELLPLLIDKVKQECEVRLKYEWMFSPPYQKLFSKCAKHGNRLAKERRAKGQ